MGAGPLRVAGDEHRRRPPIPIVPVDRAAAAAAAARGLDAAAVWLAAVAGAAEPRVRRLEGDRAAAALPIPTRNAAAEPALTVAETALAVDHGRDLAARAAADGITVLVGTVATRASALAAARLAAALAGAGDAPTATDPAARPGAGTAATAATDPAARPGAGAPPTAANDPAARPGAGTAATAATDPAARPGAGTSAQVALDPAVAAALARHAGHLDGPLRILRRLGDATTAVLCGAALGAGERGLGFAADGPEAIAAAVVAATIEPDLRARVISVGAPPGAHQTALLTRLGVPHVTRLAPS